MEQKCFSIKTPDFDDSMQLFDSEKRKKILEKINKLEAMENDRSLIPHGKQHPSTVYGKTLSKLNKNIYVMEHGDDRIMSVIIEKDNKKIYVWYWAGAHEEYNKKINTESKLNNVEKNVTATSSKDVSEKLIEITAKEKALGNMKQMQDKYGDKPQQKHHSKKRKHGQ